MLYVFLVVSLKADWQHRGRSNVVPITRALAKLRTRAHVALRIVRIWLEVMQAVYRHVVLGDEGGHLELVARHHRVQVLHAGQRVHLRLDRRRHERREPPCHHFCPKRGMYNIKRFQVLLILVRQHGVDLFEPGEGRMVGGRGERMEVRDHVVPAHYGVQQLD